VPVARRGEAVVGATTERLKRDAWGTKAVTVAHVVGPVTDLADSQAKLDDTQIELHSAQAALNDAVTHRDNSQAGPYDPQRSWIRYEQNWTKFKRNLIALSLSLRS